MSKNTINKSDYEKNKSTGPYSEGLEKKHNESCTIINFQEKIDALTSKYNFNPDTTKCIAEYSAKVINRISLEPKEIQTHPKLLVALDRETKEYIRRTNIGVLRKDTESHISIQKAANDENIAPDSLRA